MKKNTKWVVIFLLPGVALFTFIFLTSLATLFVTSFTEWSVSKDMTFTGLKNYVYLFTEDENFIQSIKNTIIWIVLQSLFHVLIGVIAALLISRKKWYSNLMRTIFFVPNIISSAALGILFLCIMNPQFGLINNMITRFTGAAYTHNWFMDPKTAFLTVTLTWLPYAGLVTILVLAEMSSISEDVYEAAVIDGATKLQTDIYIVLPLMRNIIGTSTVLAATSMLQKLDIIMMTTSGGPGNKTMNMPMYLYKTVFTNNNYGLANAQGVILILLGMIVLVFIRKIYRMDEEE